MAEEKVYGDRRGLGKAKCLVASTGNLTLNDEQTVNGVALVEGDACLVVAQTAPAENGIYIVKDGRDWVRRIDADSSAKLKDGALVFVAGGTLGVGLWRLSNVGALTLGTTAISAEAIAGQELATVGLRTYTANATTSTNLALPAGTITKITAKARTALVSTLGTVTVAITLRGNTVLVAATFDMETLVLATLTTLSLTVTAADLIVTEGDVVQIDIVSDNADAIGGDDIAFTFHIAQV